jgi:DNA polymerase-3 subunit alpha
MAAVMNCDIHLTDKLGPYKQEVDRLGIETVPPCVNRSGATFGVEDGRILYALGALKNVGVEAMRLIEDERRAHGPFTGLFDFAARVDLRRAGKRALEMLARAGALDALDSNRRKVFETLEQLMAWSGAVQDDKASAQVSLFGEATTALPPPRLAQPEDWTPMERLAQEHAAIGFYLSGHPLDDYAGALRRERVLTHAELLRKAAGAPVTMAQVAGTVAALDQRKSARGTRFAFVRLSDPTGLFEVRVFSDVLDVARDHLEPGLSVVLTVEATLEGDELKLLARAVQPIDVAVAGAASAGLRLYVGDAAAAPSLASRLATIVRDSNARRRGPVSLVLMDPGLPGEVEITLPDPYPMSPQVLSALKTVPGVVHVEEF